MFLQSSIIFQNIQHKDHLLQYTQSQIKIFINYLQNIQPNSINIIRIIQLIKIFSISILDHLQFYIIQLRIPFIRQKIHKSYIQQFLIVSLSLFKEEDHFEIFKQLNTLTQQVFKDKKIYFKGNSQTKVDTLWKKTITANFTKQDIEYYLQNELKSYQLNYLETLLLKKSILSQRIKNLPIFTQLSLKNINFCQQPLCCKTYFNQFQDLSQQSYYPQNMIQYFQDFNLENQTQKHKTQQLVCGLLNNNGGLIIYGIQNTKFKKQVKGGLYNSDLIERIKTYFRSLMESYYPNIIKKKMYRCDFVPIRKLKDASYIAGNFILRIKVQICKQKHVYHFKEKNEEKVFMRKGKQNIRLEIYELYDFIREKILNKSKIEHIHIGQCEQPQNGMQIYSKKNNISNNKKIKYKQKKIYDNMTMIRYIKQEWKSVQNYFKQKKIDFREQKQYERNNFIIISHNYKLDNIKKLILQCLKKMGINQKNPFLVQCTNKLIFQSSQKSQQNLNQIIHNYPYLNFQYQPPFITFQKKQYALQFYLYLYQNQIKAKFK